MEHRSARLTNEARKQGNPHAVSVMHIPTRARPRLPGSAAGCEPSPGCAAALAIAGSLVAPCALAHRIGSSSSPPRLKAKRRLGRLGAVADLQYAMRQHRGSVRRTGGVCQSGSTGSGASVSNARSADKSIEATPRFRVKTPSTLPLTLTAVADHSQTMSSPLSDPDAT